MTASDDLRILLGQAIADGVEPWLPGFGPLLAGVKWDQLRTTLGVTPSNYGTARMRATDPGAEREVAVSIRLPAAFGRSDDLVIEGLRPVPAARYTDLGLELASPVLGRSPAMVARVKAGLETIATVPSIAASVGSVLKVLHVVVPEGANYDVSYSDPEVPFSIFVGVSPEGSGNPVSDLRLAEGILHEAMHLQLTLVEEVLPLVADESARHHSPWQDTMRPARGVLHGIYVFAVIRDFMRHVASRPGCGAVERRHSADRMTTASEEIREACASILSGSGLTPSGRQLVTAIAASASQPDR